MFSQITIEAMKSDIDEVALQGIEFWSNVCDEEMDLAIEASEVSGKLYYFNQHKKTLKNCIAHFCLRVIFINAGLGAGAPPRAHQ